MSTLFFLQCGSVRAMTEGGERGGDVAVCFPFPFIALPRHLLQLSQQLVCSYLLLEMRGSPPAVQTKLRKKLMKTNTKQKKEGQ
jgi:hypothetical protein